LKRIIALITVFAFAVVLAGMAYADFRSPAEKLSSGRAYLKLLDQKIIKHRKLGNAAVVKDLQAQKKSTIARMKKWKAEMEAGPAPVAPPPPVSVRPTTSYAGWFGWGLDTGVTGGYVAGNSVIVVRGDLLLGDGLQLGPWLGLSEDTIEWKIGLGAALGTDTAGTAARAVPLFVDGIINLPADWMFGIENYVGGGVNYVLYGTGRAGGSYGGQVSYGLQGDVGLGGISYAEIGYSIIRSGAITTPYSMRGIGVNFGTEITL